LKNNKTQGTNEIRGEMLKYACTEVVEEMYRICNMIWKGQSMPEEWTKSVLLTIPKKGDLNECRNAEIIERQHL
jgi:hypothetical protein